MTWCFPSLAFFLRVNNYCSMAQGAKIQLINVICFGATNVEHRDQGNQIAGKKKERSDLKK